jgi:sodium-independent sulfate anion transporter 11
MENSILGLCYILFCCNIYFLFFSIEIGIYVSTGLAFVVILAQLLFPKLASLGIYKVTNVIKGTEKSLHAFVPLGQPSFKTVQNPPDGILIFRLDEPLYHFNASYIDDKIVEYTKEKTRKFYRPHKNKGEQPWNDSKDTDPFNDPENLKKPRLRAVIFDFSSVSVIDSTVIESLIGLRKELNKYSQHLVEFHFANIANEKVQSGLIIGGFGELGNYVQKGIDFEESNEKTEENEKDNSDEIVDIEKGKKAKDSESDGSTNSHKKFFHLSIEEALEWADS